MPSPSPLVSVVMPVRNALPFLDASIRSILGQTHRELELVIRDDCSDDGSAEALRRWSKRDSRIRVFEGREVLGPAGNSNWVVRQARSDLVGRMDADDVSHPDRLCRQVAVLAAHADVVLVGSLHDGIDARSRTVRGRDRWRLARPSWQSPFQHGTVLFRREVFERVGGYREACDYWEDNDLFLRFAAAGRVLVLPDRLYRYRFSGASCRTVVSEQRMEAAMERMLRCGEAHAAGRPYDALLAEPCRPASGAKLPPEVFLSIGTPRLWAGRRPGVLRSLLRRGDLRPNRRSVAILAWALLGTLAPRPLRGCLAARGWLRDLRVRRRFPDGVPCEWRPHRPER